MTTATVSSKGQITIPADVRHALHVDVGDRVEFVDSNFRSLSAIAETMRGNLSKRIITI